MTAARAAPHSASCFQPSAGDVEAQASYGGPAALAHQVDDQRDRDEREEDAEQLVGEVEVRARRVALVDRRDLVRELAGLGQLGQQVDRGVHRGGPEGEREDDRDLPADPSTTLRFDDEVVGVRQLCHALSLPCPISTSSINEICVP